MADRVKQGHRDSVEEKQGFAERSELVRAI